MCNSIKAKVLGVDRWSLLLVFLLIISMFIMVACDSKEEEVTTQEFELVSCYIEFRNKTNMYGGILRTDEYFHYGYVDGNGKVIFGETDFGNHLDLRITEETPKVIIITSNIGTNYTFELTREMYNNLNSSQE